MRVRYAVLLPALLPLVACVAYSLVDAEGLVGAARTASDWILATFDWLFSGVIFACVAVVAVVYFGPLGKVTIGGEGAVPLLNRWRWVAVTVCTTIATGILFWGVAEPIYHLSAPPAAGADDSQVFALSTLFLHWTVSPYAMYTVGGLAFAVAFYNRREPFAVSGLLSPVFGAKVHKKAGWLIDSVCLFALVAGMAAALGAGTLSIIGGLERFDLFEILGVPQYCGRGQGLRYALVIITIVLAFSLSAASGLQRGIRQLSNLNFIGFLLLAVFVFLSADPFGVLRLTPPALADYALTFLPRSLGLDPGIPTDWSHDWTAFYWANWFAWAPITALFIGRLGVGYTVREFIRVNLVYTSLFGAAWMLAFGASALLLDGPGGLLQTTLAERGPEAVAYALLAELPAFSLTAPFFLLLIFLSYVTAADSNITAMSALCTYGITPAHQEAPTAIKLIWGLIIGSVAWILLTFAGLDGIRLISTLGGFPAVFLIALAAVGLLFPTAKRGLERQSERSPTPGERSDRK